MQVNLNNIRNIYFLGIGGIGMSALARYFYRHGIHVEGYDRTCTQLTLLLEAEGIPVHYTDDPDAIPADTELVIYTPAVPRDMNEFQSILKKGTLLLKRSEVLGWLSHSKYCIAVSGSHGKTTTSTLIAHLLHAGNKGCLAFLGGIAKNYNSNIIEDLNAQYLVAEADEYDRSFLQLSPSLAVITAIDPDHLDIYGNLESLRSAFAEFISQIQPGGKLLIKAGVDLKYNLPEGVSTYTYGFDEDADYHPTNIILKDGKYHFKLVTPQGTTNEFELGIPGYINIENATAALAVCLLSGSISQELIPLLSDYQGVVRRLDKKFDQNGRVYIDDYAHHPEELRACISSVKRMYPDKKITGIFQPHLFTRTRDMAEEFAQCLAELDEIILLEIYPARELPIPGIDSSFLLNKIKHQHKYLVAKENLLDFLNTKDIQVLLTLGAGDIDQFVEPIVELLSKNKS